ncbi:hypothetical protein GCM10009660_53680 [Catellatospora bangladeshensis]
MPAHRRGAEPEPLRDRGGGDRALLQQQARHAVPRPAVVPGGHGGVVGSGVFHNTSVAYFAGARKDGHRPGDPSHAGGPVATLRA